MNALPYHINRGKAGESLARLHLTGKGFEVLACNWRSGRFEIDVIAARDGVLHFIEVKTRHSTKYGYPEESVTRRKFNNLKKAAACFLTRYPGTRKIQFDILSILRLRDKPVEYLLIEDVYM